MSQFHSRKGYTLLELIISIGASSILVMGLGSSLYLAGQAVAPSETLQTTLNATEVLHNITDDVQNAIYLSEHSDKVIEFVVRDMDGDNSPDVVRYEWSGTPGDPLIKKFNYGSPVEVVEAVENFELKYNTRSTIEDFPPSLISSEEQLLGGFSITAYSSSRTLVVSSGNWPGFYFEPSLPASAEGWTVSKVRLGLSQDDAADNGAFDLQMRTATGSHLPTSNVLEQVRVYEAELPSTIGTKEYAFSTIQGLLPTDRLCGVLAHVTGTYAAKAKYHYSRGEDNLHLVMSNNQGGSWYDEREELLFHEVWGTYYQENGSGMTVTRNYFTGLNASLQIGDSTASNVRTGIPLLNSPESLAGLWEVDFDGDPLGTDINFDNLNDWSLVDGDEFDTDTLTYGVWEANDAVLRTTPAHDFIKPTTIVVRMRATTTGGEGAVFQINADWDGSNALVFRLRAVRQANNTQTFIAEHQATAGVWKEIVKVENLPLDFLEGRVVISPEDMNHAIFVQGNLLDNYNYTRVAADSSKKYASLYESGCDAEFDYVSIRVSE